MKKFKIEDNCRSNIYVNKYSREFINLDIPDVYMEVDGVYKWIIDRRYGVLTIGYCELKESDRKLVLDFIIKSSIAFYKWSYTWESNRYKENNLFEDVDGFVKRFYKEAFIDYSELNLLEYDLNKYI